MGGEDGDEAVESGKGVGVLRLGEDEMAVVEVVVVGEFCGMDPGNDCS